MRKEKEVEQFRKKYRTPDDMQKDFYNEEVNTSLNSCYEEYVRSKDHEKAFENIVNGLKDAGDKWFTEIPKQQRQPYITKETWNVILDRDKAYRDKDNEKVKELNKEIKKMADKDKKEFCKEKLIQKQDVKENWKHMSDRVC